MKTYMYIGPRKDLRGKTALVQVVKDNPARVKAQFDDMSLPEAFGWHEFPTYDFNIRPSELADHWDVQGRN